MLNTQTDSAARTGAPRRWLSPRIWRSPNTDFNRGDALSASKVYTPEYLRQLRSHGFDAVWVRGRLADVMHSTVLPELNSPQRDATLQSLRITIDRCAQEGMKLYLFFNDPLAIMGDNPFWEKHPDLRGARHVDFGKTEPGYALCTATPTVKAFMAEATGSVISALPGLGGVILITASEHHTHCWSHYAKVGLDDGIIEAKREPLSCPRCISREPAEVVGEIVTWWRDAVKRHDPTGRVLVWNWSWSFWYPDPQTEVINQLPDGVELQADFERGGYRPWRGEKLWVDEYSLGYVGPSERFTRSQDAAAARGIPTSAKLQIGTTHEMASVPNLPLIANLHAKFVALDQRDVRGAMCTWAIGCWLSLNTYAMGLYAENPDRYQDADTFFDALAQRYLGLRDAGPLAKAWRLFSETWAIFPFSIRLIYVGPTNIAPGLIFEPAYRQRKMAGTWHVREDYGDAFETACGPYSLQQVTDALRDMAPVWEEGLAAMEAALADDRIVDQGEEAALHRTQELSCARMIALQIRSSYHLMAFHQWRLDRIAALKLPVPCEKIPLDDQGRALMQAEIDLMTRALPLCEADDRLGYHHEAQGYQYNAKMIRHKIDVMRGLLVQDA